MLAGALLLLVASLALAPWSTELGLAPLENSPDVMIHRAQDDCVECPGRRTGNGCYLRELSGKQDLVKSARGPGLPRRLRRTPNLRFG